MDLSAQQFSIPVMQQQLTIRDCEQLDQVYESMFEYDSVQLHRSSLINQIQLLASPRVVLYQERYYTKVWYMGALRSGMIAFSLPAKASPGLWWKRQLKRCEVPFARSSRFLEMVYPETMSHIVVVLSEDFLFGIAESQGVGLQALNLTGRSIQCDPLVFESVRQTLLRLITAQCQYSELLQNSGLFDEQIASLILKLLTQRVQTRSVESQSAMVPSVASRIVQIVQQQRSVPTIKELCRMLGMSRRTMELHFRNETDESPVRFLRVRRLCAARRDLLHTLPGTTSVTRIMQRNGFRDAGRFAAMYSQMFDELPRRTLNRVPRIAPVICSPGID